ncbi:hypothetical protein C8Q73DRAFT_465428 [Cubamyces lactineus]|nr:hypothetical protein C8Q73DRAFT_465428 [Cubamyces lactineus]
MSLSSLPPELLLSIFQTYAPEAHRTWLASVTTLCKALNPVVESVLYRDVTITSDEGIRMFCRTIASEPSRSVAVRKLALVFHSTTASPPVDAILRSAFLSLVNLTWLQLDISISPSGYLASLVPVDAPFRLRSLSVMSWHYQSFLEDLIASQPSLETLTIGFGGDWGVSKHRVWIFPAAFARSRYHHVNP